MIVVMVYEWDEAAAAEARAHALPQEQLPELRRMVRQKQTSLGPEGVRAHCVSFDSDSWNGLLDGLPEHVISRQAITRGDLFDIAQASPRDQQLLFLAVFLWGTGKSGYGPARYRRIVDIAGESRLRTAVAEGVARAHNDPIDGYAAFYGGHPPDRRARPHEQPWCRVEGLGPAFFTKLLYFTTRKALILDRRMADAVCERSGMNEFRRYRWQWSPYRYAVYLHWMSQTATSLNTTPGLLELTMFQPPGPDDEPDATEDGAPTDRG